MNYDEARQLVDGPNKGKWHYTSMNDGFVHAIGYCGRFLECPECEGHSFHARKDSENWCEKCQGRGVIELSEEERCQGHDTAEEACEHYRQYIIDNGKFFLPTKEVTIQGNEIIGVLLTNNGSLGTNKGFDQLEKCLECDVQTDGYWRGNRGWSILHFCSKHQTKEMLQKHYPKVHSSWHS